MLFLLLLRHYNILQNIFYYRLSQVHLPRILESTTILSMAVHPNSLHQYWGCRTPLATTSIEAISNILRPEILRKLNDNDVSRIPWSSTPRKKSSQTGGTKTELCHIGII